VSTNANGKYLLPTHLDPTIILTSALSTNEVRKIARVVTLTDGEAGVERRHLGRRHGVVGRRGRRGLRRHPDVRQPVDHATVRAQALVQASISAFEDIADLGNDVMMMFADAKDRLEGAPHATGAGTTTPKGVFTAVHAVSGSKVTSTTAATIGLVDLNASTWPPKRYRGAAKWLMNPTYTVAIKALGTAISASYSGDLRDPTPAASSASPSSSPTTPRPRRPRPRWTTRCCFGDFSSSSSWTAPAA
jgi:HK97 family phage major capsid protein